MEIFSIILCFALMLLIFSYFSITIILFDKKGKELINDYEKLLNLKDWYEKISEEANRSYIIESVEKRGHELVERPSSCNTGTTQKFARTTTKAAP